jgi:restriction system protein
MRRQENEDILSLVAHSPWWVGLVFAAAIISSLRFVLPSIAVSNQAVEMLVESASPIAWFFAVGFLLTSAVTAFRAFFRDRLLKTQQNVESLRTLAWAEFESLVSEAFRRHGYAVEERCAAGPHGGADLLLWKADRKVVVHCKRWKQRQIGESLVRELHGLMLAESADEAVFVSSGDYTAEARAFVRGKPMRLMDGYALLDLLMSVQRPLARAVAGHPDARLDPLPIANNVPHCPRCGAEMVIRTANAGEHAGQPIWACWGTKDCRGTRSIGEEL